VVADCLDGISSCVVVTRADHTNAGERSADVKVPVYFAGQQIPDELDPTLPAVPGLKTDQSRICWAR